MITVLHNGVTINVDAKDGDTILQSLVNAGVYIAAPCGGKGKCGKCRVRLVSGNITKEAIDRAGTVRACKAIVFGDATVQTLTAKVENFAKPKEQTQQILRAGIALDVGTTTVIATLIDLTSGRECDRYNALNAQEIYGADVISRISASINGKTNQLHRLIIEQTNSVISGFLSRNNIKQIQKIAVSANTTMLHLFANVSPATIGVMPFSPVFTCAKTFSGESLGINAVSVELLPSVAGFLGGDIVAGIVCQNLVSQQNALLIDMGTNGEMALSHDGKLFCCSTATGPALEGAEISCGKGGTIGAIDHVSLTHGAVSYTTISNSAADGICGSGLIDAIAVMLDLKIIDDSGAFDSGDEFVLSEKVSVTQGDVRKFQLAKSAIKSGIVLLAKAANLTVSDIKKVYITGGLGFYLSPENAMKTGMLPKEFSNIIEVCPNLSLEGAKNYLLNAEFKENCAKIRSMATNIELAANPEFMNEFSDNMFFEISE